MTIMTIDVGGSNVKCRVPHDPERRRFPSGDELTPDRLMAGVREITADWSFDRVTLGLPIPIRNGQAQRDPVNLGPGWQGIDWAGLFGCPVKLVNDAAMQAVGHYEPERAPRMLFLGLGTGLGSCYIDRHRVMPMELGHVPWKGGRSYEEWVGEASLDKLGKKEWRPLVLEVATIFRAALLPDEVVLGGGNAKKMKEVPEWIRLGENALAFDGGFRLWEDAWVDALP